MSLAWVICMPVVSMYDQTVGHGFTVYSYHVFNNKFSAGIVQTMILIVHWVC
jgi:hypothetical protein